MDPERFDSLTRSLSGTSRRRLLAATGGIIGLVVPAPSMVAKKNKGGSKKPTPNQFGCLNVGQRCFGKDSKCCSGICGGKKPKTGQQDRRKCAAHNTNGCSVARNACASDAIAKSLCNPPDPQAFCFATTGNAGFCGTAIGFQPETHCLACTRDPDCEAAGFAPGSACILFVGGECLDQCAATGGRACFPPAIQSGD
jgi:hypothetical protein